MCCSRMTLSHSFKIYPFKGWTINYSSLSSFQYNLYIRHMVHITKNLSTILFKLIFIQSTPCYIPAVRHYNTWTHRHNCSSHLNPPLQYLPSRLRRMRHCRQIHNDPCSILSIQTMASMNHSHKWSIYTTAPFHKLLPYHGTIRLLLYYN